MSFYSSLYIKNTFPDAPPALESLPLGPEDAFYWSETAAWLPLYNSGLCDGHCASSGELKGLSAAFGAPVLGFSNFDDDEVLICYCDPEKQSFLDYRWEDSGEYDDCPEINTDFPDFLLYLCPPENRAALREVWNRPSLDDDNSDNDFFAGDRMEEMIRLLGLPCIGNANDEPAGYRRIAHFTANEGYVRFEADSPEGQDTKTVGLEPLFWQRPRTITVGAPVNLWLTQLVYPAGAGAAVEQELAEDEAEGRWKWNQANGRLRNQGAGSQLSWLTLSMLELFDAKLARRVYLKTPRLCSVTIDQDISLGWGSDLLKIYEFAGNQPVAVFRYLNTTAGHLLLSMEFTPDGKQRLSPERTRLPGQTVQGCAYTPPPLCKGTDSAAQIRALYEFFAPSLPGGLEEFAFTWAKLWPDPEKDGPQTVRELSELLGFPLFFPFFPCEEARLIKSTQLIDRYRLG